MTVSSTVLTTAPALPLHHVSRVESQVLQLHMVWVLGFRLESYRNTFPSQTGVVHRQSMRSDDPDISWSFVTTLDVHNVSNHKIFGVDFTNFSISKNFSLWWNHLGERLHDLARLVLLVRR